MHSSVAQVQPTRLSQLVQGGLGKASEGNKLLKLYKIGN
jgi:hypothetical protein